MNRSLPTLLLLAGCWLGVGCGVEPAGAVSGSLLEAQPLAQLGLADVATAPPSCEGLLDGVDDFAQLGDSALIVGLDPLGTPVCADSCTAVEDELRETGRADDLDTLLQRTRLSEQARRARGAVRAWTERYDGDPNPEPNQREFGGGVMGDPFRGI